MIDKLVSSLVLFFRFIIILSVSVKHIVALRLPELAQEFDLSILLTFIVKPGLHMK